MYIFHSYNQILFEFKEIISDMILICQEYYQGEKTVL